jgi:UDP-glucose 6-dehydrogenase
MSDNAGLDAIHIKAADVINKDQNSRLYNKIIPHKHRRIGIVGLSFKPNTVVDVESPGKVLYDRLKAEACNVVYYDKLIQGPYTNNIEQFIMDCDVIVLSHDDKTILSGYERLLENKIIINPWNIKL